MLALLPLLAMPELLALAGASEAAADAGGHGGGLSLVEGLNGWQTALVNLLAVAAVVLGGSYLTTPLFRFIAAAGLRELFTATALMLVIDHKPNELSGGQRQRVAIARSLINEPRLLLADEPTGNLDSRTSDAIMDLLQELNRDGQTIVMVTHEQDIANFAQRQVHMMDGSILREERHAKAIA